MAHRFDRRFPDLKGTLFVVTYGRSGSTLLQGILQTIPGAHIAGENHNVMESLWHSVRRLRMTRDTWGKKQQPPTHPWYGADKVTPGRFAERLVDSFVAEVLHPPVEARWIGFKEIRYNALGNNFGNVLDFMTRYFKNPHFIFNSRRAEDVAQSAWWADWDRGDVLKLVRTMDARFESYCAAHPENTHRVVYDDLIRDPAVIAPLFERLGEPYDEERIRAVMDTRLTH